MMRAARVWTTIVIAMLTAGALPGCGTPTDPPATEPAVHAETVSGPVRLRVSAESDRIGVADRLRVVIRADWEPGATTDGPDLPLADTGWRLVSRTDTPTSARAGGRLERSAIFTLEPDLPGQYEIPGATVTWSFGNDRRGVATVAPMPVVVIGSLDESADLLAVPATREPPQSPEPAKRASATLWLIVVLGSAAVLCELAVVGLWLKRRLSGRAPRPFRERIRRLESLTRDPNASPDLLCESAADVIRLLSRRHATPELAELREHLDTARFAPTTPEPATARTLAARLLDTLCPAEPGEAREGGAR